MATIKAYPYSGWDGDTRISGKNASFSSVRAGVGNLSSPNATYLGPAVGSAKAGGVIDSKTTGYFSSITRPYIQFGLVLPSDAVITNVTLSLWGYAKRNDLGKFGTDVVASYNTLPPAPSGYHQSNWGSTSYGYFSDSGHTTTGYQVLTLNAAGRAYIKANSNPSLGLLSTWDVNNNFTGAWVPEGTTWIQYRSSRHAGGQASAPLLTVTYDSATPPPGEVDESKFIMLI